MRVLCPALLLLSSSLSSVAIRNLDDALLLDDAEMAAHEGRPAAADLGSKKGLALLEQLADEGASILANMSCDDFGTGIQDEVAKARQALTAMFSESAGAQPAIIAGEEQPMSNEETVALATQAIVTFTAEADERKCLPAAMTKDGTQALIRSLLDGHLGDVLSGGDPNVSAMLDAAYTDLVAWQHGTVDVAGPDLERTVLFEEAVEDPANCPPPCGLCQRKHNSWRKGEELFSFKCLLQRGQQPPSEPGLSCTDPKRRGSFWRPHVFARKTWCKVEDWKKSVCQQLKSASLMTCGIRRILDPLQGGGTNFNSTEYSQCLARAMRMEGHGEEAVEIDARIPHRNRVAWGLVMSLGLANGLAGLRDASKTVPVGLATALLDPFLQGRAVNQELRSLFNGTSVEGLDPHHCHTDLLEECRPRWKRFLQNLPTNTLNGFINFLFYDVLITSIVSIPLFYNAVALAAIGWLFSTNPWLALAGWSYALIFSYAAWAWGQMIGDWACSVNWCFWIQDLRCPWQGPITPASGSSWTQAFEQLEHGKASG